jgi:hypothetical protein
MSDERRREIHPLDLARVRGGVVMVIIPAPAYSLAKCGWIPRLMIWRDDGSFGRREGEPCESWAEAMQGSWRPPAGASV